MRVESSIKHIAFFMPSLVGGGAERVMLTLMEGFCDRGFDVDLIISTSKGVYLDHVPSMVRVYSCDSKRVIYSLPKLLRYLRRNKPDALISAMEHANVIAIIANLLSGVNTRLVITTHTNVAQAISNAATIKEKIMRYWIWPFYRFAHKIVVVSEGAALALKNMLNLPSEKVKVIYNPVITKKMVAAANSDFSHPWYHQDDCKIFVSVGRLTKAKDYPTLIRAFAKVRALMNAKLIIIGEGEERFMLENLSSQLGIREDVSLPGFIHNPYAYMKNANLFVMSSRWEGFGNVLAEAIACGVKVVSTDYASGAREILDNGRLGIIVPIGDDMALSKAMIEGVTNFKVPDDAFEYVKSRFSSDFVVDQYIKLLFTA